MNAPPVIDSRASFKAALRWGFDAAIAQDARRIVCADADFAEWPWDDPELLDALANWFRRPQRRLVLLAGSYDEVPRRHPRFNAWRAAWAHAMDAWQPPVDLKLELPTLLSCDRAASVHLVDARHWRGRCSNDERQARRWCDEIDACLQHSERAFPVNTLGL